MVLKDRILIFSFMYHDFSEMGFCISFQVKCFQGFLTASGVSKNMYESHKSSVLSVLGSSRIIYEIQNGFLNLSHKGTPLKLRNSEGKQMKHSYVVLRIFLNFHLDVL